MRSETDSARERLNESDGFRHRKGGESVLIALEGGKFSPIRTEYSISRIGDNIEVDLFGTPRGTPDFHGR